MPLSRRPRVPAIRFVALAVAASAAAVIGLGSAAAYAAPTTTATPTSAPTITPAASTTTAGTTTARTSTASTSTTSGTTTAATSGSTTPPTVRAAPGPQCAGKEYVLTPVLCIPTGSGEDQPAPVGTDGFLEFAAQVVDNGPAVLDATVVITLPPGLRLDTDEDEDSVTRYEKWWSDDYDDDGTGLDCTTSSDGATVTCATGAIATGANFLIAIDLDAQDDTVAGTSATFTVALQSTPEPGLFPRTSVQATVDYVGTAHLQVRLSPTKATVVLGHSLTLAATVHNVGPNPAVEAAGVGFAIPDDFGDDYPFLITNSQPFPGGFGANSPFALRTLAAKTNNSTTKAAATAAPDPSPIGFWPIGTIPTGATVTVTIVVKAVKAGQVDLEFDASSADESCESGEDPSCENDASAALTAVAAASTTVPSTTAATSSAATTAASVSVTTVTVTASAAAAPTLPNTGFRTAPWLGTAGAAILLGLGLMVLGAPRRRARVARHRGPAVSACAGWVSPARAGGGRRPR